MYKEYETLELTLHTAISFPTPLVSAEPLLIDRCRSMIASVVQRLVAKVHSPGPFTTRGGVQDQSRSHVEFWPQNWLYLDLRQLGISSCRPTPTRTRPLLGYVPLPPTRGFHREPPLPLTEGTTP